MIVNQDELFDEPEITFIIVKETKKKHKLIIGVNDHGSHIKNFNMTTKINSHISCDFGSSFIVTF